MTYLPDTHRPRRHAYGPNKTLLHDSPTRFLLKFLGASLIIFMFGLVLMVETNIL